MHHIKDIDPAQITISEHRQRKEFDADSLHELMLSIQKLGLLHPIVLRSPDNPQLVSGERRLRACQFLLKKNKPIRHASYVFTGIPCTYMGDLDELEYEEAELEENICRDDLTWQEKARAIDRLHSLRCAQDPEHTMTETAEEVMGDGVQANATEVVRHSQIISQHLDDPDVAKAKSKNEALKLIRKKMERSTRNEIASLVNTDSTAHILHHGCAFDLLPRLPTGEYDCIITDPPYGIGADQFGDQATTEHEYADSPEIFRRAVEYIGKYGASACKVEAHLYLFMDLRHWRTTVETLQQYGWEVWHAPIIWCKGNGMLPRPDHAPRRTYEAILFANKGNRKVTGVYPDVINVPPVSDKRHGAEKPVALYEDLLRRSCYPGDKVLDPFAGSGPVFPAANRLQLVATGINKSKDDYNLALGRLNEDENNFGDLFND